MNVQPECFIIGTSTMLPNLITAVIEAGLREHGPTKELEGKYQGKDEVSFLVMPENPIEFKQRLPELLDLWEQDAALYLDSNRQAYLAEVRGEDNGLLYFHYTRLGPWKSYKGDRLDDFESATYDRFTDLTFVAGGAE